MIETKLDKLHGPTYDAQSAAVSSVDSVTQAFEGWFDTSMRDLPEVLRHRVERDFFAMPWDDMTPDKRRSVARHWDCQHDPATEQERQFWEDFFERESAVKVQIAQWGVVATPTAGDLDLSESRLKELRQELARMETQQRRARGDGYPERKLLEGDNEAASTSQGLAVQYVAYPKAMHQLSERLNATPEELAAWVWLGPKDGGLAAYLNVNELDPPPRFYQDSGKGWGDHDYVSPLMACWFSADAISRFDPGHRYITGSALIERWSKRPELKPVAFIQAKICESRLLDLHPICGLTQGSCPEDASGPPLTTALFKLSEIETIESEDFPVDWYPDADGQALSSITGVLSNPLTAAELGMTGADRIAGAGLCAVFLAMQNLGPGELSLAFVGDKSEAGLGANNMLEVSARKEIRRIPLAALDLVDRRKGALNSHGTILLGMAQGRRLTHSPSNSTKMKRLRDVLRKHLGLTGDPFRPYSKAEGWLPRFNVVDKRGAADERATRDAERRTDSYDGLVERGAQFTDSGHAHREFDEEGDPAAAWLNENDHDAST